MILCFEEELMRFLKSIQQDAKLFLYIYFLHDDFLRGKDSLL